MMLERIAKAICEAQGELEHCWHYYKDDARAALWAMLEPTPAMLEAGNDAMTGMMAKAEGGWSDALAKGWEAMVMEAIDNC